MKVGAICLFLPLMVQAKGVAGSIQPASTTPPLISTLLKPEVYKRVLENKEVMTHAVLEDSTRYSYYASMVVRASLGVTRKTLTDYDLYAKMIPYVDKSDYNPKTRVLDLVGGIWKFKVSSQVLFEEKGERWIHFTIIAGHFQGLQGDLIFESLGEKGTLVYLHGEVTGTNWPPTLVIERGAEIIFGYTGKKMSAYIEEHKSGESHGDTQVPQPRRRF